MIKKGTTENVSVDVLRQSGAKASGDCHGPGQDMRRYSDPVYKLGRRHHADGFAEWG